MSYRLFLLPSSKYITKKYSEHPQPFLLNNFPIQIISLVDEKQESVVIITKTKTKPSVMVQFPKAQVFEKNLFGEPNDTIINYITSKQPILVVLDRCFYEVNGYLFNKILQLQKKQGFYLVNITNIQTALELSESIKFAEAKQIDFPMCCAHNAIQFFNNHTSKISFYYEPLNEPIKQPVVNAEKEDAKEQEINCIAKELAKEQLEEFELERFELKQKNKPCYLKHCYVKTEQTPVAIPGENLQGYRCKNDEINKAEFHFYKLLLESLHSVVDMELFHGFLAGIIKEKSEQNPDYSKDPECLPLLNLDFITNNYFNRNRLPNIQLLTLELKYKYIDRIQPEIKILLSNAPELLERIRGFFRRFA